MPTSHFLDDEPATLYGAFAVTGHQMYETLAGQRTVPVLDWIDVAGHTDRFTRKDEARIWTAVEDGRDVTAIYVGLDRGAAKLIRLDGSVLRVQLSKLVETDRQFVRMTNAAGRR